MTLNILIVSAVIEEQLPIQKTYNQRIATACKHIQVSFLISGIGILQSTYSILDYIYQHKPDLVIQVGIAGSYQLHYSIGTTTVNIIEEIQGDWGKKIANNWMDIFDLGYIEVNQFPYQKKWMKNPWIEKYKIDFLPLAIGVTVNQISDEEQRGRITSTYNPDVETMEGASLFYTCLKMNTPFLQIRSISNKVGVVNKSEWDIKGALESLHNQVIQLLLHIDRMNI